MIKLVRSQIHSPLEGDRLPNISVRLLQYSRFLLQYKYLSDFLNLPSCPSAKTGYNPPMQKRVILWLIITGVALGLGYYFFRTLRPSFGRSTHVLDWLRSPSAHPEWAVQAGTRCLPTAPFVFPTSLGLYGRFPVRVYVNPDVCKIGSPFFRKIAGNPIRTLKQYRFFHSLLRCHIISIYQSKRNISG